MMARFIEGPQLEAIKANAYTRLARRSKSRIRFDFAGGAALASAAKLDDVATIPFRRPAYRHWLKLHHRFALGGRFQTQFLARLSLPIKSLRHRSGAADF